ncbi:glycosyltransferase family 4 protein [Rhodococcoides trifolii]|nr:glycosyltransferase family 4 protein [Rhodococcus trifolii]
MTGSEWFDSRPGGLNRYFESLFSALRDDETGPVTASAFGDPIPGGTSWSPTGKSLPARIAASRVHPPEVSRAGRSNTLIDSHFALYGNSRTTLERRTNVITHFQGPWAAESKMAGARDMRIRAKFLLEKSIYSRSDAFVVLCQRFKDVIVGDYGIDPDIVEIIPGGVDLERFAFAEPETSAPVVVCARRLERRMGIDVLINAWPEILRAEPDARLFIVGKGTYEDELRALVTRMSLDKSITFEGRVSDARLNELYRMATVTAIPSLALEGFGLIALESLASGRPPVVTDCGGLPDTVVALDPSLVVPIGDADALAARIVGVFNGIGPTAKECRVHAETFAWDRIAARHRELYASLF